MCELAGGDNANWFSAREHIDCIKKGASWKKTGAFADELERGGGGRNVQLFDYLLTRDFARVVNCLKTNTVLQALTLYESDVTIEIVNALADALRINTTLTYLSLSCAGVNGKGAELLADVLCVNTTLKYLYLGYNYVDDAGIEALAEALKYNTGLKVVDLTCNSFGLEGTVALADALRYNTTMVGLILNRNDVGARGGAALQECLMVNVTLEHLEMVFCSVPNDVLNDTLEMVSASKLEKRRCARQRVGASIKSACKT